MKNYTRTLLRDIKAAAQIGHIESLWAAMDGLAQMPEVKGNHPLNDSFIAQVLLPVAQALSGPRVSRSALLPLVNHEKTAIRATASSAMALRFLKNINGTSLQDLQMLAKEPRPEVRETMILACQQITSEHPKKLGELISAWQTDSSPRLQSIAIRLMPNLPKAEAARTLELLTQTELPNNPEVRPALEQTINQLGQNGADAEAIQILQLWSQTPETFYWVITRCLAKSWAAAYPNEAMQILTRLAAERGPKKKIRNALQAFQHHGAYDLVLETIQSWKVSDNPNLQQAGEDATEKLIQSSQETLEEDNE